MVSLRHLQQPKSLIYCEVEHRYAVLASAIIEHCIQPRCLLSPMDADYCAQIIKVIHTQGTLGFPTLMCYDKVSIMVLHETMIDGLWTPATRRSRQDSDFLLQ